MSELTQADLAKPDMSREEYKALSPADKGRRAALTYQGLQWLSGNDQEEIYAAYKEQVEEMPLEDLTDFFDARCSGVHIAMHRPFSAYTEIGISDMLVERMSGRTIYGFTKDTFGVEHMLEVLTYDGDRMKLCMKYQRIIGGRLIAYVSRESVMKFFEPIRDAREAALEEARAGKHKPGKERSVLDNVAKMIPDGNTLKLPRDTVFKNYKQLKAVLNKAGGKYKDNAFVFKTDAKEVQDRLVGGEVINPKREKQQFYTPRELARRVRDYAAPIPEDALILEPSAGQGALLEGIDPGQVHVCELDELNCTILEEKGYTIVGHDFLKYDTKGVGIYDVIIANPPFTRNQDIDHVMHMYELLKPGGRLVSVMGRSWWKGTQKKQKAFSDWLTELGGRIHPVEAGAFKESGTKIETCIVQLAKPVN